MSGGALRSQIRVESDYRLPPFPTAQIKLPLAFQAAQIKLPLAFQAAQIRLPLAFQAAQITAHSRNACKFSVVVL